MKKIVIILIVIFCLGLAAAGFWYWQRNPYSKEILKLEILGPEETEIFDQVVYTVKYKNNGNVRLEQPRLIFEFPEYSVSELSLRQEIGPEELGDIYPGEEKTVQFQARLFGKEGDLKTVKATLSYQPKNLQARYESTTSFTTKIKPIPLAFDFDLSSKIEPGREFKFFLNYYSSLIYPLSDLGIKTEYPAGFEFSESQPKGLEKNEWGISLLNPNEGGRIEIQGKLSGEINEQKSFKAELGIWLEDQFIPLKEITRTVEISEPSISISQQINGQNQYIASPGDSLHYEIYFRNIGSGTFNNLFLAVKLNGQGFDLATLKSDSGQFKAGDNSIIWDWRDVPKLSFLGRGEEGKVEFWVELKKEWQISNIQQKNVVIKNKVLISQAEEEFEIKVNSKLTLGQEISFDSGANIYTIKWQARNYLNDLKNVKIKATLPQGAKLTGQILPESERADFAYDSQSREIVWALGEMEAGKGVLNEPAEISFQVALDPGFDKVINEAVISGEDQWTGQTIEAKVSE